MHRQLREEAGIIPNIWSHTVGDRSNHSLLNWRSARVWFQLAASVTGFGQLGVKYLLFCRDRLRIGSDIDVGILKYKR